MKLIGSLTSPYVRKVRVVMAEKKLDYQCCSKTCGAPTAIAQVQPAGQGAVPGDGRRRGGLRFARHRRIPRHAVAGGQADPGRRAASVSRCAPGRRWPTACSTPACRPAWSRPGPGAAPSSARRPGSTARWARSTPRWRRWPRAWAKSPGAWASTSRWPTSAVGCALGYLDFRFPQIDWRGRHANLARLHDKLAARSSFIDTLPPTA